MNYAYLGIGSIVLLGTVGDLLWTTVWDEGGAGPFTSWLMSGVWRTLLKVSGGRSRILSVAGPAILIHSLVAWLLLIWGAWTLIFASAENTIFDTINGDPISWLDLVYFSGYTIFTLGNGGFAPVDGVWQIATVLSTASGMFLITLIVTYVLSVLDAVTQKHAFAQGVTGIGTRAESLVQAYWNGEKFDGLDLHLDTFSAQINTLTANHNAYPILHYFHSERAEKDPVIAIAVLDETLTLLRFGIEKRHRPSDALLTDARSGVQSYAEALSAAYEPADRSPPSPDLTALRDADLPVVADDSFGRSLEETELDRRRRLLLAVVEGDARRWPQ